MQSNKMENDYSGNIIMKLLLLALLLCCMQHAGYRTTGCKSLITATHANSVFNMSADTFVVCTSTRKCRIAFLAFFIFRYCYSFFLFLFLFLFLFYISNSSFLSFLYFFFCLFFFFFLILK